MKLKIVLLMIISALLVGCTNISKMSYDDIVNSLSTSGNNANTFKKGFKYFTPKGLQMIDAGSNYVVLASSDANYYLYFDVINYIENKKINYQIKSKLFYSKMINYNDKLGYVEIKELKNDKYLIEIMYNYAKIEVMVDEYRLKSALANTINILKSVEYDKNVIKKMLAEDDLISNEEIFDIFKTVKSSSDVLEYVESSDTEQKEEIKDTDFID